MYLLPVYQFWFSYAFSWQLHPQSYFFFCLRRENKSNLELKLCKMCLKGQGQLESKIHMSQWAQPLLSVKWPCFVCTTSTIVFLLILNCLILNVLSFSTLKNVNEPEIKWYLPEKQILWGIYTYLVNLKKKKKRKICQCHKLYEVKFHILIFLMTFDLDMWHLSLSTSEGSYFASLT